MLRESPNYREVKLRSYTGIHAVGAPSDVMKGSDPFEIYQSQFGALRYRNDHPRASSENSCYCSLL